MRREHWQQLDPGGAAAVPAPTSGVPPPPPPPPPGRRPTERRRPIHIDPADLARIAYQAYGETTGHKNFLGEPMPAFKNLGPVIQAAWTNAAKAIADACKEEPDA